MNNNEVEDGDGGDGGDGGDAVVYGESTSVPASRALQIMSPASEYSEHEGEGQGIEEQSVFSMPGVKYTEKGLLLPGVDDAPLAFSVWEGMFYTLRRINKGILWCLGDALNYGERQYGETYTQAAHVTGFSDSYLATIKWVVSCFPMHTRLDSDWLEFGHYSAVASLMKEHQDVALEILQKADEEGLSVKEVKFDASQARQEFGMEEGSTADDMFARSARASSTSGTQTMTHTWGDDKEGLIGEDGAKAEWLDDLLDMVLMVAKADSVPELYHAKDKAYDWAVEHELIERAE